MRLNSGDLEANPNLISRSNQIAIDDNLHTSGPDNAQTSPTFEDLNGDPDQMRVADQMAADDNLFTSDMGNPKDSLSKEDLIRNI